MQESLNAYILSHFDDALSRKYIKVYYQPVIRTISGQLCSFEALARWQDPVRGLLRPDQFIPVLEHEKRIHELDGYIIYEVCRQIRQTIDSGATPIPVSINLSRIDFYDADLKKKLDEELIPVPKRGPGRPKGSKNKKTLEKEAKQQSAELVPKRKPGRPKGSKNKPKTSAPKRGRGRPRKDKTK